MAVILDKLRPIADKRINKLERKRNWLQTIHDGLPEVYQRKQDKKLDAFARKANKKLLKPAFDACDKTLYADSQRDEKLQRYDVKNYLTYRRVQHQAAKAIFKAAKAGKDWSGILENMTRKTARIRAKRSGIADKLEQKRQAFLTKHSGADPVAFNRQKAQLQEAYDRLAAELTAGSKKALDKKQASLQARLNVLSQKIRALESRYAGNYQMSADTVLSVRGLKMYFSGLKAVDDLDFDVKQGEIFGLIGPNGAGKTTVFNCITQFYKPTDGQLLFRTRDGETISLTDYPVHDIILKGIARTFQNVEVVKEVSVLDNLLIAATRQYTSGFLTQMLHLPLLHREERAMRGKAEKILKYMDLTAYRDRLCWGLPYGVLKRVEIARVLMCNPQLIILDEPAAGLNESETRDLAKLIRRIRTDFCCTVLLVEHDMSLVMNVCDHICAISFGKKLAYGTAVEIQASKEVQEAYLGTGGT